MLEVVDEKGNVTGRETREHIHREGLLHREVHVWLYTPDGRVVLQRRAIGKDLYPGLLDSSVGGHVEAGSDYLATAVREMREETGIEVDPSLLEFVTMYRGEFPDELTGHTNNFLRAEYMYQYDGRMDDLRVEEGEGAGFEAWSVGRFLPLSEDDRRRIVPGHADGTVAEVFRRIRLKTR